MLMRFYYKYIFLHDKVALIYLFLTKIQDHLFIELM